nr:unnamed protein product [Fasciola hepatica]
MLQRKLDCDKPPDPPCSPTFQNALAGNVAAAPPNFINRYWSITRNALQSAGLVSCGLPRHAARLRASSQSMRLLDSPQMTPDRSEHNEASVLNASPRREREILWSQRILL